MGGALALIYLGSYQATRPLREVRIRPDGTLPWLGVTLSRRRAGREEGKRYYLGGLAPGRVVGGAEVTV